MGTYTLRLFDQPDAGASVGRYLKEVSIDAEDDLQAVAAALAMRLQFPSQAASADLHTPGQAPFWRLDLTNA